MLRFTIRDVLWLTLVVGLVVGWWVDRGRLERRRKFNEIVAELRSQSFRQTIISLPPARVPADARP